nr:YciI family protein [Rhodococcus sp. HNM0569]
MLSVWQPDGPVPGPDELDRITDDLERLNREMHAAGVFVLSGGLEPPEAADVVLAQEHGYAVQKGPFTRSDVHVGGFTVVDAVSRAAAVEWAERLAGVTGLAIEVRAFAP